MSDILIEVVPCPLCGNSKNQPYTLEKITVSEQVFLGLNCCKECGMNYVSPKLSKNAISDMYNDSYNNKTLSGLYHTDEQISIAEYLAFSNYVKEALPGGGTVLDVGCGVGNLLQHLNKLPGIVAEGIELSTYAADIAKQKGLNVINGDIGSISESRKYDCIVLLFVLEHVPSPRDILNKIYSLLNDNGVLIVGVPNYRYLKIAYDNIVVRKLFNTTIHPDEHLQNFTPLTIKKMINLCGFEVSRWGCAKPLMHGSFLKKMVKKLISVPVSVLARAGYNIGGIHLVARKKCL